MFFGPSIGALLSVVLFGLGLRDALNSGNRAAGIVAVIAGAVAGYLMADIRC